MTDRIYLKKILHVSFLAAGATLLAGAFGVSTASGADIAVCTDGVPRVQLGAAVCSASPDNIAVAVGYFAYAEAADHAIQGNIAIAVGDGASAHAVYGTDNHAVAVGEGAHAYANGDNVTDIVTPGRP